MSRDFKIVDGVRTVKVSNDDEVKDLANLIHERAHDFCTTYENGGQVGVAAMCQVLAHWIVCSYPAHPELGVAVDLVISNFKDMIEIMRKARLQ